MRVTAVAVLAAGFSLVGAGPANAEFSLNRFITQGDSAAGWINEPNAPPGASDQQSVRLYVNGSSSSDLDDAARAIFKGFGPTPDPSPPSFDFKASTAGASGGSVRFLLNFSDGGKGELRPTTLVEDQWTHVGGVAPQWDSAGGTCGNQQNRTYPEVLACHPGASIRQMEVLNDSGWLHPGGFEVIVDNITYAGTTISKPAPPVLGEGFVLNQVVGRIAVRVGAKSTANIEGTANLPVGSVVDTRKGHAKLTSARPGRRRQVGRFTGGIIKLKQGRKKRGLVDIILSGSLAGCAADGSSVSAATAGSRAESARRRRRHRRRRVWGRGRGRYRTRGRYSAGTVRGTKWLTEDTCNGTLTLVREGVVAVRDFRRKKTVLVHPGERYLARKHRRHR